MTELLAELFSSKVRAAVLAHLLPRPHLGFSLTDLSRRLDLPISSLQHECYKLTRLGVLRDERAGAARLYRPEPAWPLAVPLTALVVGAIGARAALAGALERVPGLELGLVAGNVSAAAGQAPVYLVLVGESTVEEVDAVFARAVVTLGAVGGGDRVELAYFRPADWRDRRASGNPFVQEMLSGPCLVIVGDEVPVAVV